MHTSNYCVFILIFCVCLVFSLSVVSKSIRYTLVVALLARQEPLGPVK